MSRRKLEEENDKSRKTRKINDAFQFQFQFQLNKVDSHDYLFMRNFEPCHSNELALHSSRIKKLEQWFNSIVAFKNTNNNVLLLTGPSGSCKTTAIKVFSKEFNFKIKEWMTSSNEKYSNNLDAFESFINSSKFKTSSNENRILLLIDDIPHLKNEEIDYIVQLLYYINQKERNWPIVITYSDLNIMENKLNNYGGNQKYTSNEKFINELKKCNIPNIEFIKINKTQTIKALKRICDLTDTQIPKYVLEDIFMDSNGNLNYAMNCLLFNIFQKRNGKNLRLETIKIYDAINEGYNNYHILGKIMYNKKDSDIPNLQLNKTSYDFLSTNILEHYSNFTDDIDIAFKLIDGLSRISLIDSMYNISDFTDRMSNDNFKAELVKLLYMTRNRNTKKPSHLYSFKKPLCYTVSQVRKQNEKEYGKAIYRYGQDCNFLCSKSHYIRDILPWLFKMNLEEYKSYLPSTYKDIELTNDNELNIVEYALI